jgi:Ca2+-binding RTX toxin-like protein
MQLRLDGGYFKVARFIPVDLRYFISDLVFDRDSGRFFAERQASDTRVELFAIETDGTIFTLGGAVANTFQGDHRDDYYMGLGGNDVIFGDLGEDVLDGGVGDDSVRGGGGDDIVFGEEGNDGLSGDIGDDTVSGGEGLDTLRGGGGNDHFEFNHNDESSVGTARDRIVDFVRTQDKLDLTGIDAKIGSGNQAFTWIGRSGFHDTKGELRYRDLGSDVIVQGDVDGDGSADFEILVSGVGQLKASDFLL